jgi:uncharacterized protein DUF5309
MPATMTLAPESTANVNTLQHVRDVDRRLRYLDPDAAPFTLVLAAEGSSAASNFKTEWVEKGGDFTGAGFAPKWSSTTTTGTGTSVVLTASTGGYFKPNDLVKVPRTSEVMHVTSVATDTLTVTRGVGSTVAAALVSGDDLVIIGSAWPEGGDIGTPQSFQEIWRFNYTQIFRNSCGATRTQSQTANYLGEERARRRKETGIEHKIDIERAFLFGERNRHTTGIGSTNAPVNLTGGVRYWMGTGGSSSTSVGTLTEAEVWTFAESVFSHTGAGDTRTLYASSRFLSVLDQLGLARVMTSVSDETYGISVKQWKTSHGTFNVVKHRLLEFGPGGTQGYGGHALALHIPALSYKPLQTTQLLVNRQNPGVDGWKDEYLTECGLQFANPLLHGELTGLTG